MDQELAWQSRYRDLQATLLEQYRSIPVGSPIRLAKRTSNLFRSRDAVRAALEGEPMISIKAL